MLKLGKKRRGKAKAPQKAKQPKKSKAPKRAKSLGYQRPPPIGTKFRCDDCGGAHTLIPCSNESSEYEDHRYYYCGDRLRLACLSGINYVDMSTVEES